MKPEEGAELILWDWLRTQTKVYFNRVNKADEEIFVPVGIKKIPDLLIKIKDFYGIKYYAIEVKDNSSSINVRKASKIIDIYYKNYIEKKTKYLVEGKEIKISGFLISTQNSPKGYLFKKEEIRNNLEDKKNKGKLIVAEKYKTIPLKEGNRTHDFVRGLWDAYGKIRNNYEEKCDLGILIGNSEDDFSPWLQITNYNKKRKGWGQKWWKI